jgi:hypothetical protein
MPSFGFATFNVRTASFCVLLLGSLLINAYFVFTRSAPEHVTTKLPLPLGYQPFEYPRNFGAQSLVGAIVTIGPKSGFSYTYHLSKCGIDIAALVPQEGIIALPTISKTYSASGSATADVSAIGGIKVEGQTGDQFTVSLLRPKEIFLITGDVLSDSLVHVADVKRLCGNFLNDKNSFWIPQAIVSDDIEIAYSSTRSASALVNAKDAIKAFASGNLGIKGDGQITEKGSIKYNGDRIYIGFREALPIELLDGKTHSFSGNENATSIQLGDFIYASE